MLVSLVVVLWQVRQNRALARELASRQLAPQPDPELSGEVEALRVEAAALGSELARARSEAAGADQLARNRDELAATVADLEARHARALEQLAQRASDLAAAEQLAVAERARTQRLSEELAAERSRSLDGEPAVAPTPSGPDLQRADACDRLLGRLEAGEGRLAAALYAEYRSAGLFAPPAGDGSAFLADLVAAAEGLEDARSQRSTSTSPGTQALIAAHAALERAVQQRSSLAVDAADWIVLGASGRADGQPAARLARVDQALAALQEELGGLGADVAALHARDWDWIFARGPRQDPVLAVEHAATFACRHDAELAELYAAALAHDCCPAGTLDVERLGRESHLSAWAGQAAGRAPERRLDADRALLWFDAAQRWYLGEAAAESFDWHGLEAPRVSERGADWRAELWLRVRLAAPESAWPPRPGEVAVYRLKGVTRARWRSDSRAEREQAGSTAAGWTWLRGHYDDEGRALGEPVEVAVEQVGVRTQLADGAAVLLDLRTTQPDTQVAPQPELWGDVPPPATGVSAEEARALTARAGTGSGCLIVRQGDTERWFSPELGLVLEQRDLAGGSVRVELAAIGQLP